MTIGIFLTQDNPDWFTFLVLEEEEKGTGIDHKKSSTLGNRDIHRYLHASKRSVTTIKGIARSPEAVLLLDCRLQFQPPRLLPWRLVRYYSDLRYRARETEGESPIDRLDLRGQKPPGWLAIHGGFRGSAAGKNDQDVQRRDNHSLGSCEQRSDMLPRQVSDCTSG